MGDDLDDIAALRADNDLVAYLLSLTGATPAKPLVEQALETEVGYHIPRPGAWPCGTAAAGPTPPPCAGCQEEAPDAAR